MKTAPIFIAFVLVGIGVFAVGQARDPHVNTEHKIVVEAGPSPSPPAPQPSPIPPQVAPVAERPKVKPKKTAEDHPSVPIPKPKETDSSTEPLKTLDCRTIQIGHDNTGPDCSTHIDNRTFPPRITWSVADGTSVAEMYLNYLKTNRGRPSSSPARPSVTVRISLLGAFYNPLFLAECDRPCTATGVVPLRSDQYGLMDTPGSQLLFPTNKPNVVVAGPNVPVLDGGADVYLMLTSGDDDPINIMNVKTFVRP